MIIGGHHYSLTCADGEEPALLRLGGVVDAQVRAAKSAISGLSETRQLLFAALFLADRLEGDRGPEQSGPEQSEPVQSGLDQSGPAQSEPVQSGPAQSGPVAPLVPDAADNARLRALAQRIDAVNQRLEDNLRVITSSLSG